MKRTIILLAMLTCFLLLAHSVGATTLTYTDSSQTPGNDILYTLSFDEPVSGTTYQATFTVTNTVNTTSPAWYANWFLFKFDGSGGAFVSNLTPPSTNWSIFNVGDPTQVLGANAIFHSLQPGNGGFSGFFSTSIMQGSVIPPTIAITQGIPVNNNEPASPFAFTFDFTLPSDGTLNLTSMPFKVGYYDVEKGKIKENKLSTDLASPVPEPATMFLLGFGLIGVGVFVRRRFKK
jgi:hypothetical protein